MERYHHLQVEESYVCLHRALMWQVLSTCSVNELLGVLIRVFARADSAADFFHVMKQLSTRRRSMKTMKFEKGLPKCSRARLNACQLQSCCSVDLTLL